MIQVPVYNVEGQQIDTMEVDPAALGGRPNKALLKQAVVMYQSNRRQGTSATKSRGMVEGSTRKLYRQKGTGNARMGTVRTVIRRGGGVAFAKKTRSWRQELPKKARRTARNHALLAKLLSDDVLLVSELKFDQPTTKTMARILSALRIDRGCTLAVEGGDANVVKSARNIDRVEVRNVSDLNAHDILLRRKLVMTRGAMVRFLMTAAGGGAAGKGGPADQTTADTAAADAGQPEQGGKE